VIDMTRTYNTAILLLLAIAPWAQRLSAQALPAAAAPSSYQGFQFPTVGGQLTYGVSASQTITTGYGDGNGTATVPITDISGDLAYISRSETHPFSMVYSGGYLASESSQMPSSWFHNLALSQSYRTRTWNFVLVDTLNYLPDTPVGSLSGIAGVGDLGVPPVQVGVYEGPGVLTNYAQRVSNMVSGSAERNLTGNISLTGTGSYSIQRFLTNPADATNDNNEVAASSGINDRLDARNTIGANYSYMQYTYIGQSFSFVSNGVNFEYIRNFSPRLNLSSSLGPEWTSSSLLTATAVNLAAAITLTYSNQRDSASLAYTRGTNSGSGVVEGTLSDIVGFSGRRSFNRAWTGSTNISYIHSESLQNSLLPSYSIESVVAGAQISRAIGRYVSSYASYTLEHQTTEGTSLSPLAYSGLQQVFGFGVTYSPGAIHLGR
jgi:hypothetical protein